MLFLVSLANELSLMLYTHDNLAPYRPNGTDVCFGSNYCARSWGPLALNQTRTI